MIIKLIISLLFTSPLLAAEVDLPTTYATGGVVTASNLNGNFTSITAQVNGGLDNENADTMSGYRFYEIKAALPSAGSQGRTVFQTSDNSLNLDTGSGWISAVVPSGTLATGRIPIYNSGWTLLTPGSQYYSLVSNGASSLPSFQQVDLTSGRGTTGTLAISQGGTGQTTAQAAVDALLPSQGSANGKFLTSNGSASSWGTVTQNIAQYNTTAPLVKLFEDTRQVTSSGGATHRSSPFSRSGTVNVSYTISTSGGAATGTAYVRKNGVQAGTTNNESNASAVVHAQDLAVSTGDYFDIFISACSNTCTINNFNISAGNLSIEESVAADNSARIQPKWAFGTGAPSSSFLSCNVGDLYSRLDGGASTSLYVCTSANAWTAK